jgi:putative addiction module component (TIGR02574 family)
MSAEELLKLALDLPEAERADMAARLIQSLDSEMDEDVEAAWSEEIHRRIAAIDSGEERLLDWDEVRARLFKGMDDTPGA